MRSTAVFNVIRAVIHKAANCFRPTNSRTVTTKRLHGKGRKVRVCNLHTNSLADKARREINVLQSELKVLLDDHSSFFDDKRKLTKGARPSNIKGARPSNPGADADINEGNNVFDYLDDIQDATSNACIFIKGLSKEEFLADKLRQQAIAMNLIIIGESVKQLLKKHPELVDLYPDIPWYYMKGTLLRTEKGYFNHININDLWDTVQMELPNLLYQQLPELRKGLTSPNFHQHRFAN